MYNRYSRNQVNADCIRKKSSHFGTCSKSRKRSTHFILFSRRYKHSKFEMSEINSRLFNLKGSTRCRSETSSPKRPRKTQENGLHCEYLRLPTKFPRYYDLRFWISFFLVLYLSILIKTLSNSRPSSDIPIHKENHTEERIHIERDVKDVIKCELLLITY